MKRLFYVIVVVLYSISCSDNEDGSVASPEPAVTEIGMPIGDPVTKDIGSAGGTITSGDGKLDVVVPAGALSNSVTFSIQPVENFCPGGRVSYELLPEGLTFSQPVELVFHYTEDEMEGSLPDFLGIAYQGEDRIWYRLPAATVDPSGRTVSVPVKHFTRWALVSGLDIVANPPTRALDINKSVELSLVGDDAGEEDLPPLPQPANNPSPDEDYLPPLPQQIPFTAKWYVNGVLNGNASVGTIIGQGQLVTYKAPASVPANNPVTISAELTRFRFYDYIGRRVRTFNQVLLFKRIKINPDEYNFTLKVEITEQYVCAYKGQTLHDVAVMDVFVEAGEVTVTNFVNEQATIAPTTVTDLGCQITCDPVGGGPLNADSGEGTVTDDPFIQSLRRLDLTIAHSNASTPANTIECPNAPAVHGDSYNYVFTEHWTFTLQRDSVQRQFTGGGQTTTPAYKATLTPH